MPDSDLLSHSTVTAYRKILDERDHHQILDGPSIYDSLLGPPTDEWEEGTDTLVEDASHILRVVLKRPTGPLLAQADREVFADLLGPWNGTKWNRVRDKIKKLKRFADGAISASLTLVLADEHLFKVGADWHKETDDDQADSDNDAQASCGTEGKMYDPAPHIACDGPITGGHETGLSVSTSC